MDPILNASREGNIDGLYAAIRDNPHILSDIDAMPFVDTPLHIAASAGHARFAMEIMRLKPSFATKLNLDGLAPIHIAMDKNYEQLAICLVEAEPGLVRVKGREGFTPLHLVAKEGHVDLLERFLTACPESIRDVTVGCETALLVALNYGKFEAFQLLLESLHKGDIEDTNGWKKRILNHKDLDGNTILHISTSYNQLQAIQMLEAYNQSNPGMLEGKATNESNLKARDVAVQNQQEHMNEIEATREVDPEAGTHRVLTPREQIYSWEDYFKLDFEKSTPDKIRTDLLVVAVLMATCTYQAALTPPGGTDGSGISRMDRPFLVAFMLCNSAGFYASLITLEVLLESYPMYGELLVAMIGMITTYNCAVITVMPTKKMRIIIFCCLIAVIYASFFWRKHTKERRQRRAIGG